MLRLSEMTIGSSHGVTQGPIFDIFKSSFPSLISPIGFKVKSGLEMVNLAPSLPP